MTEHADVPTHARRAWGCRLETADGRTLVDTTMALGAVALGYADPEVNDAVSRAAAEGIVCGLPPLLEIEVAEQLVDAIPCAEQVRFLKSGAEATAAALRIARTLTGRDTVIAAGYFGWHDWSSDAAGIPAGARADIVTVPFDDLAALDSAVQRAESTLAAIIVEPLVHHIASVEWLRAARAHCTRLGAVLIFDEIKTAFRMHRGGVQALTGVTPDLTTLGKAMANGFPLAAVVGTRAAMSAAARTWISSTLATETTALAAARVVLERHRREDVCGALAEIGREMQRRVSDALAQRPCGVHVDGPPAMWRLVATDPSQLDALVIGATREGVLLKRGAYLFPALAHDEAARVKVGEAVAAVLARIGVNDTRDTREVELKR